VVLVLARPVFEVDGLGFDLLRRAAQCFIFRVKVVLLFGVLVVGDVAGLFASRRAAAAVSCVMFVGLGQRRRVTLSCGGSWRSNAGFVIVVYEDDSRGSQYLFVIKIGTWRMVREFSKEPFL
jgi:hypothetical protein